MILIDTEWLNRKWKKNSKTYKISEQNPKEAEMEAGIVARQAIFQIVVKDEWKMRHNKEKKWEDFRCFGFQDEKWEGYWPLYCTSKHDEKIFEKKISPT